VNINNGYEIILETHIVNQMLDDDFKREYIHAIGEHEEDMDGGIANHGIEHEHLAQNAQTPHFTVDDDENFSNLIGVLMLII